MKVDSWYTNAFDCTIAVQSRSSYLSKSANVETLDADSDFFLIELYCAYCSMLIALARGREGELRHHKTCLIPSNVCSYPNSGAADLC